MPSEQPNENMDKVLKAYAKKRREDSSQMEMDLATRNMLQGEVKRTLAEVPVPAASKPRPRFAWWPQLIIGVASAAALAIAVLVWKLPSRTETNDSAAVVHNEPAAPVEAPTTTAKELPEYKDSKANTASAVPHEDKVEAPPSAVGGASKPSEEIAQAPQRRVETGKKAEPAAAAVGDTAPTPAVAAKPAPEPALDVVPPAPAPAAAPSGSIAAAVPDQQPQIRALAKQEHFAAASNLAQQQQKQRIQFSQINNRAQYRVNLNSPPLPKVLTNFGLERTGTNLVVRDSDGSVYAGKAFVNGITQNRTQAYAIGGSAAANSPASNGGETIPEDNFAFSVSGYNRKLRQKVIFSGNVTQNAVTTNGGQFSGQQNFQNSLSNAQQQSNVLQMQNILLNGRVQVGRNSEFDIQAAPITK